MTDIDTITKNYFAAWNETDAGRREKLLEAAFTAEARFQDPIMQGQGRADIGALMDGVHEQYPGFRFALKGKPDGYIYQVASNGYGLMPPFGWRLTPKERWAVVAYIRALEYSQSAPLAEAPANERANLMKEAQ